jgi:putative transposase
VLVDGRGIPIGIVIDGANRHDVKLLEATLESQRMIPDQEDAEKSFNLCLDKAYDSKEVREILEQWGYVGHIPPRDEANRIIHDIENYKARRWTVERLHAWTNRFRRLLIRWEKKPENYMGMIHLSFACIAIRAIQVFG